MHFYKNLLDRVKMPLDTTHKYIYDVVDEGDGDINQFYRVLRFNYGLNQIVNAITPKSNMSEGIPDDFLMTHEQTDKFIAGVVG